MDPAADPFPSSLPTLDSDSPPMFDTDMAGTVQSGDIYFNSALPEDSPGRFFHDDMLANSPFHSPASMKVQYASNGPMASKPRNNYSASPESSLQDSSSDSSRRHKRKTSSKSSFSGLNGRDLTMTDARPSTWKAEGGMNGTIEPKFGFSGSGMFQPDQMDVSNRAMENDFDFDSAASSPSPGISANTPVYTGNRHIAIPYRASSRSAASLVSHSRTAVGARELSPLSAMIQGGFPLPTLSHQQTSSASSNEDVTSADSINGMERLSTWPYKNQRILNGYPHSVTIPNFQSPINAGPVVAPSVLARTDNIAAVPPALLIHPTPHKSRVETQIPIKMILFPMPTGIKRLHLPAHTISKPKLLAKPPPIKAADLLELHTMLVCTSAMQDPVKMRRAFARAAQGSQEVRVEPVRRSSSGDITTVLEEEDQPLNGGPVHICEGCILRERKRAARKKSKKPEEEEPWQRDEAKRIIVFNTSEIREWQLPSESNNGLENTEGLPQNTIIAPDNSMQIEVPMRIACYCRHQNEKLGFQVIFSIKDYQNNLVAQAITNPIVITDDHKTHAPPAGMPNPASMFPDHPILPCSGMFNRESLENYGAPLYRNAHSTTDLQTLQQNYNPQFFAQPISPFAVPQNSSHSTSMTLAPRNLSRQASPSAQSGPLPKRRKASGSGKIPDVLTMTRLQTSMGPNVPNQSWNTAGTSNPVSPSASLPFAQNFQAINNTHDRSHGQAQSSRPAQIPTGPPTPGSMDQSFISAANRSQSLENLSAVQQMFSAPNSARPSRAPSPSSAYNMSNTMTTGHTPSLVNTAIGLPNGTQSPRLPMPTIHKLIPNEGTKAGGIEVTCLGSGFCQGLEVMFGDSLATTTTYWGETSLVCLLPPAIRAGTVAVTFKHQHQQQIQLGRYSSPPIPKQQVFFKYVDDDEQELVRHALLLVHQKMTGTIEDVGEIARRILSAQSQNSGAWSRSMSQTGEQMRQASNIQTCLASTPDVETAVLKCVDLIDLDDSPFQAHLNLRRPNGQGMLHLSASLGYHRLVAGLLARGANPDLRDRNGMSPMHMAALNGHAQIVRRLRLAGGDPTLRSLRGYTPADMATSQSVLDSIQALHSHSRSRSADASTVSLASQASSTASLKSLLDGRLSAASFVLGDSSSDESDDEEVKVVAISDSDARKRAFSQRWADPQRMSQNVGTDARSKDAPQQLTETAGFVSAAAAMTAWRDQLAAQIQHFHQSVNWTLPSLQVPTLPPMPNMPDYQAHAIARRFSSLVPQRQSPSKTPLEGIAETRDNEYRWWELLTGTTSSPPAYEEIYPAKAQNELDLKTESVARAAVDALADQKCRASFDTLQQEGDMGFLTNRGLTSQQQEQLKFAHERKVMRLQSDRKLFFFWIPVLALVVMAVLFDRVPQVWRAAERAVTFLHNRYQERVVEVV